MHFPQIKGKDPDQLRKLSESFLVFLFYSVTFYEVPEQHGHVYLVGL